MGYQLWQHIFMLVVLVYYVKGHIPEEDDHFSLDEVQSSRSGIEEHESHQESRDSSDDMDDSELSGLRAVLKRPYICYYSPDRGECSRNHPRFYYDYKTHTCRFFLYSGCGGNANRFLTRTQCIRVCKAYQ